MQHFSVDDLYNATVIDADGDKVGGVSQVYVDDQSGLPDWVTVKTGLFGGNESFVPLEGATLANGELRVPHGTQVIKDAPNFDADHHLSVEDENRLYQHYNVAYRGDADRRDVVDTDRVVTDRDRDYVETDRRDVVDTDRDVVDAEGTAVRREERLNVGKDTVETGRARLRKYVETDTQTVEVPVKRERLVVEREPIAEGDARNVGTIGDHDGTVEDIVLREERVNVSKETVGVERVNIGKETVSDTETVTEEVKKERFDIDTDGDANLADRDLVGRDRAYTGERYDENGKLSDTGRYDRDGNILDRDWTDKDGDGNHLERDGR